MKKGCQSSAQQWTYQTPQLRFYLFDFNIDWLQETSNIFIWHETLTVRVPKKNVVLKKDKKKSRTALTLPFLVSNYLSGDNRSIPKHNPHLHSLSLSLMHMRTDTHTHTHTLHTHNNTAKAAPMTPCFTLSGETVRFKVWIMNR